MTSIEEIAPERIAAAVSSADQCHSSCAEPSCLETSGCSQSVVAALEAKGVVIRGMASRPKKIREVSGGFSPRISSRVLYFGDGLREQSILSSSGNTPQTNAPPPGLFCCLRLTQLCSHPGHAGRELGSMCAISAEERGKALYELIGEIDRKRQNINLSSAIRVFVLDHFRTCAEGPG